MAYEVTDEDGDRIEPLCNTLAEARELVRDKAPGTYAIWEGPATYNEEGTLTLAFGEARRVEVSL